MNILIILSAIYGVVLAQQGDIKDCEPRQSAISVRDVQDIYQRPVGYEQMDYTPHSQYGPPDLVRPSPLRSHPQDVDEGATGPRPAYIKPPTYSDVRQQFPYAPVYGPPPPRARVASAAGIYDDYEDLQYSQPPAVALAPVALAPAIRRYNVNYAHREPYQPIFAYDSYANRHHQYRVPVYYAPLPEGYYPARSTSPPPRSTTTTTTTEVPKTVQPTVTIPITQPNTHPEQTVYEETQIRRHPPIVAVTSSEEEEVRSRHKFKRPFLGLANLFRGSIISTRNKIGVIPSIVQGSVNRYT